MLDTTVTEAALKVEDLTVRFVRRNTDVAAVNGCAFSLKPGETLTILPDPSVSEAFYNEDYALAFARIGPSAGTVASNWSSAKYCGLPLTPRYSTLSLRKIILRISRPLAASSGKPSLSG